MGRSRLDKAMQRGGVGKYLDPIKNKEYSNDELLEELLENDARDGDDSASIMAKANRRRTLMDKAGFDFVDCRKLSFSPMQTYSVDQGSVEALADLIYESQNTTPLVVRAMPERDVEVIETDANGNQITHIEHMPSGLEIVDGERRCRAHLLLGERYGEKWYMVPVRRFDVGKLSDEDAEFILHAENVGQRAMSPSERSIGFAKVYERIMRLRKTDPTYEGRKTKEILAEQFGVSARTAAMEANIGRNLVEEGKRLFDRGTLTKVAADSVATLPQEQQAEIISQVEEGKLDRDDVTQAVKERKTRKPSAIREPKDSDFYLRKARQALKKIVDENEIGDRRLIAELRDLLDMMDPDISRSRDL